MSTSDDRLHEAPRGGRGTPPSSSGGDLVDRVRDWFGGFRQGLAGRSGRQEAAPPAPRYGRRQALRSQAVPLASEDTVALRPRRQLDPSAETVRSRAYRAERSTYTLVFAAVVGVLVLGLILMLSWVLGSGGPFGPGPTATATPATLGQLPNPAALGSPPPFASPSPSPSPDPGLASPGVGRIHVVEGGDTLNRIAQRYGTTVDAILQANNIRDRNRILRIGERLVVPEAPLTASPIPR